MNITIRFLRALCGIYAVVIFLITSVFIFPSYVFVFIFFNEKKSPHIAHRIISRFWAKTLFILFFIRFKVSGKNFIDKEITYVFVSNHRSQLDIPAYALACNNTFRFLAKAELMKIPVMGYVIRKLYISVNRKDKNDRVKSLENMMSSLREGISVFICPEGTRNKSDKPLLDFRDGAFRLAIEAQVPLAVLTLKNTGKLLSPLRPLELSPGIIYGIWNPPIETKGMTQDDIPALKQKVIEMMIKNLEGL